MSKLTLHLLGPPRVELDGESIHIGRTKAVALLAYLAITATPHSREALATLLWPDSTPSRGRANLRRVLVTLRHALGEDWLDVAPETVGLSTDSNLWLDIVVFQNRLAYGRSHDHPPDQVCSDCLPHLIEAVDLYRDNFLAGFSLPDSLAYDEWHFFQGERLREELVSALRRLVRWHSEAGDTDAAIPYARRWLGLDPLRETPHRRLMELYALSGQHAAALRQYRDCVRLLETELGVPPAAETTALYERIRAERESAIPRVAAIGRAPQQAPAFLTAPEATGPDQPLFVARERELARLADYLEKALAGNGSVAFITGGPGRGKTALTRAFGQRALDTHPELLVASGACNAFSGLGDPYLPFRELLDMLTGDVEARWTAGTISTEHARRLWAALPATAGALLDHGPHLIDLLVPGAALLSRLQTFQTLRDAERRSALSLKVSELEEWLQLRRVSRAGLGQERIFQQVADTLIALSGAHPLLLTLDDLQWTDAASAALLFHLGRRLAETGSRVLILGAYRPEEVAVDRPLLTLRAAQAANSGEPERHPLQKVLGELRRHLGDVWLDLAKADITEGRRFIDAYLDSPTNPLALNRLGTDFRVALAGRTGGHPLFTIELLREMQARGELLQDAHGVWVAGPALDWDTLPVRVEAAIQERIERLDEAARALLAVASVEGEVFTAQAVAQVQGLPEREVLHALSRELGPAGHRLVREVGEVRLDGHYLSRYQFGHALFQAYLYDSLSAGERRLLHCELAAALEGLYGQQTDAIAPGLVHHYQAAGYLEKSADYGLRAGELACDVYAYAEGADYWKTAQRLYRQLGNRAGEASALERLGWANYWLVKLDEATTCFQEALRIFRELGDRRWEAGIHGSLGWFFIWRSDAARAEEHLQQAATMFGEIGELGFQANALGGLGRLYREHSGDFARARVCGEEARRLSREAGNLFNEAIGEFGIGFALHYQGDYSGAAIHMQRGTQMISDRPEWLGHWSLGLVGLALNAIAVGSYDAATEHLQRSRCTFRRLRQEEHDETAWVQSTLALLHHQMGDDRTAREYAEHALSIHRKTGYHYRMATTLTRLGHTLAALGDLTEARAAYQEALDLRRQMGQRHMAPEPTAGLARVALAQREPVAALGHVYKILRHLETGSPSMGSGHALDGTDEPLRIYLTCYQVLQANGDPRADEVLTTAHTILQKRAAKIDDEELRRSYLENISVHREIASEYNGICGR